MPKNASVETTKKKKESKSLNKSKSKSENTIPTEENALLMKTKPRPILSTNSVLVKKKKKTTKENGSEI